MQEIYYNGKHSYQDLGLTLSFGKEIDYPSKEKRTRRPTYSNSDIDFSELYGSQIYTNRILKYPFNILCRNEKEMHFRKTQIMNWLMDSNGKQPLHDSEIEGYHFLAEVVNKPNFDLNMFDGGLLTIEFEAYPFKIKDAVEGSPYWDDYSIMDYYQEVEFDITGNKNIELMNNGISVVFPEIISSSPMSIKYKDVTITIPAGTHTSYDLPLYKGMNSFTVSGNGKVHFKWNKEVV